MFAVISPEMKKGHIVADMLYRFTVALTMVDYYGMLTITWKCYLLLCKKGIGFKVC